MIESSSYDTWLVVSSSDQSGDSDKIDSDIEAELYSVIHHEPDTSTTRESPCVKQSSQNNASAPPEINENSYMVDMFNSSNLYTSFETPPKQIMSMKNMSDKKRQQPNNPNKGRKRKSDCALNENPLVLDISTDHLGNSLQTSHNQITSRKNILVQKLQSSTSDSKDQDGKSEFIARVLQNIQVKSASELGVSASSRKKQKVVNDASSKKRSEFDRTVDAQNSDSDSVIWSEVEETDVQLQTNLSLDVVTLSSDSYSDDSFSSMEESSPSFNGNTSQPSTSFNLEHMNDPWHVNAEDLYRFKKSANRYHERAAQQCSNCNLKGHVAKFCTVPKAVKCFICGGNHLGWRCKDKLCYKCFHLGHDSRICNFHLAVACSRCNMRGHTTNYCPDLWRRFHLTVSHCSTTGRKVVVGRVIPQDTPLYCYNCGNNGHWGAECLLGRSDRFSFPTWATVVDYSQPSDTFKNARLPWPARNNFPQPTPKQFPKMRQRVRKKKSKVEKNDLKSPMNTKCFPPRLGKKNRVKKLSPKSPANMSERPDIKKKGEGFPRTPKASGSRANEELSHRQMMRLRRKEFRQNPSIQQKHLFALRKRLGLPSHPMSI